jgi:hypothetical protein
MYGVIGVLAAMKVPSQEGNRVLDRGKRGHTRKKSNGAAGIDDRKRRMENSYGRTALPDVEPD